MEGTSKTIILGSSSSPESLMKAALQVTPKKERAGILEKLLENETLSDEENLLDDLMRDLPVDEKPKKKLAPKKNAAAARAPRKKAVKKEAMAKNVLKSVEKGRKRPAAVPIAKKPVKKTKTIAISSSSSSEVSSDEEEDEEEEEEASSEEESQSDEEEEDKYGGTSIGKIVKKDKELSKAVQMGMRFVQLAQCKDCQGAQKLIRTPISALGDDELFCNVVLCPKCVEANVEFMGVFGRYFASSMKAKAVRKLEFEQQPVGKDKKKSKKSKFISESDDYKCASGRYCIQIGQCVKCVHRQKLLAPDVLLGEGPKKRKILAVCQCLQCVSANKAMQNCYWKFFGIYADRKQPAKKY